MRLGRPAETPPAIGEIAFDRPRSRPAIEHAVPINEDYELKKAREANDRFCRGLRKSQQVISEYRAKLRAMRRFSEAPRGTTFRSN